MYNVDEPKTKEKEKVKKRSDFSSEREWLIYQKERLQKKITKIENQKSKVVTQQKIIVGSVLIDYAGVSTENGENRAVRNFVEF